MSCMFYILHTTLWVKQYFSISNFYQTSDFSRVCPSLRRKTSTQGLTTPCLFAFSGPNYRIRNDGQFLNFLRFSNHQLDRSESSSRDVHKYLSGFIVDLRKQSFEWTETKLNRRRSNPSFIEKFSERRHLSAKNSSQALARAIKSFWRLKYGVKTWWNSRS